MSTPLSNIDLLGNNASIASIRFAGDLPVGLVIGMALLAAGVVTVFYLRETRTLASPYSYLLPALRAVAVALVILILAGPVWHRRQVVGTLGRVVFAIDTSATMAVNDSQQADESQSRIRRAIRLLTGSELGITDEDTSDSVFPGLVDQLSDTHTLEVISFDSNTPNLLWASGADEESDRDGTSSFASLEAAIGAELSLSRGARTNLAAPLDVYGMELDTNGGQDTKLKNDEGSTQSRSAIVLMTDGQHNLGESPVLMAERLSLAGAKVMTLGFGSDEEPSDLGIASIEYPDNVAADGMLSGTLSVKHAGVFGKPVTLRIEHSGETVWEQVTTLPAQPVGDPAGSMQNKTVEIPFEIDVAPMAESARKGSPRGVSRDAVALDLVASVQMDVIDSASLNGNAVLDENNAMSFRVAASTRDRRLLIVDGSSRWETRYLRNVFGRDPAWQVDAVFAGVGTDRPTLVRGPNAGEFPSTLEAISSYDAIVLGEIPPEQWNKSDTALVKEYVSRGGGLIVIDGQYGRVDDLATKHLSEIVPVRIKLGQTTQPVSNVSLTSIGRDHPALSLSSSLQQDEQIWENLPAPQYAIKTEPQPGGEVWASVHFEDGSESPWIVTRLFGAGRVFYFASDQTWRWRYKVADDIHARFWNQMLGAVMQPPYSASDSFVAIGTDKVQYDVGESSIVRVRLQDPNGKPLGDATVDALLLSSDRVVATVPLRVDNRDRGTYQGQTAPLPKGEYEVRIRASGFDSSALQATTPIWVGSPEHVELRRLRLDRETLTQIASAGGGEYFHESEADKLLESLKPLSSGSVIETDYLVWQSFYWFWLIVGLLTMEWLLRKRAGLV